MELERITDEEIWRNYNKSISYEKAVLLVAQAQLEADQAQIPAIERAAMERVLDWIKEHPLSSCGDALFCLVDVKLFESELLGKGDKINKEEK